MKTINLLKQLPLVAAITAANTAIAFDDPSSDYSTDPQRTHVWNEALEPVELVNSILCFADQMRSLDFVNEGPYLVLADEGRCFRDNDSDQSGSAGDAPSYMEVVVDVTRETNTDPLEVHAWISGTGEGEDDDEAIKFKALIHEGASDTNPFGRFTFNYDFYDSFDDTSPNGGGEVKTIDDLDGKIGFTLYESNARDGQDFSQSASVVMTEDRSEGVALTSTQFGSFFNQAFGLAFNDSNVLVQDAETYEDLGFQNDDHSGTCLSRTEFTDNVWRYDLYDAVSGDRIELNSGFGFRYDSDDDSVADSHGHVGYWGIWTEEDGAVGNGDTIVHENHETGAETSYTVITAPGRLIKHTVESMLLTEAHGIQFYYWNDEAVSTGFDQWVVNYLTVDDDNVNMDGFYVVAGLNWGEQGPEQTDVNPFMITLENFDALYMHSEQLGGEVKYMQGDDELTFYRQTFVNGSETEQGELLANGSISLQCFDRCISGTLTAPQLQNHEGENGPYEPGAETVGAAIGYTFSNSGDNALTLVRDSNGEAVRFDASLTEHELADSPHYWGVRSGPMVTPAVAESMSNPWEVYDPEVVTEFYVWETGVQHWNHMATVRDNTGAILTFDEPIQFSYRHSDASDRSGDARDFDGQTFMLSYGGNGDLHGIPHVEVENDRWSPLFNIADGTLMGPGSEYVIKAREIEQKMAAAPGQCASLTIETPEASVPTATTGSADIGAMPEVDDSPKVIAGELVVEE